MKFVTQVYFSWFGSISLTPLIIDIGSSKQSFKKSSFKNLKKQNDSTIYIKFVAKWFYDKKITNNLN
jgi:hypothetical protein